VQVLRELIAHAGSVVPREKLIALLWPQGVVDFDTGLNTVIRKLRSALGDTSETPRYIETLPRRGYRFIGALDPDPEATSAASAALPPSAASGVSPASVPPSHHEPTVLPEAAHAEPKSMTSGREPATREVISSTATTAASVRRPRLSALALVAALAAAALLTGTYALWRARFGTSVTSVRVEAPPQSALPLKVAAVVFSPPPHSIAVLPFVNISGDKEQEYFSDGLTEELLNSLAHIDGLQVAARTSSFSFREYPDIADVAHKLNVATVLEGSVRRSGHTMRIAAQLNDAVTGFHLWSQTYDRNISDVLKLQTEIATAVANALKVTLLGDEGARIELGGTSNPGAFDAYLRASKAYISRGDVTGIPTAIAAYTEAIRLDPKFALAYAGRSEALSQYTQELTTGAAAREGLARAEADARHAIALAPELAESHLALGYVFEGRLAFEGASQEYERARALAPGMAKVLGMSGHFAVMMGKTTQGLTSLRHAAMLDPLARASHTTLGAALYLARQYQEAVAAFTEAIRLAPDFKYSYGGRGLALYALGDLQGARASCETGPDNYLSQECLPIVYDKLGRHADAEAELAKLKTALGEDYAYSYATIYAQWGDRTQALELLERAVRVRDAGLCFLKTDPLLDPLRNEPRFQAVLRELKFP